MGTHDDYRRHIIIIYYRSVYLLSSTPDGALDWSRVHILNIADRNRIVTRGTAPDTARGFPPTRKQAAIETFGGQQ